MHQGTKKETKQVTYLLEYFDEHDQKWRLCIAAGNSPAQTRQEAARMLHEANIRFRFLRTLKHYKQ